MSLSILFAKSLSIRGNSASRVSRMLSTNTMMNNPNSIKVTTYNVLSSHLSEADYFTNCDPKHLHPPTRLRELKRKLDVEVEQGAIICLQEVSTLWAGTLHAYFANRGYSFSTGLYGHKFNGYMGVAIAAPLSKYDVLDVDITRVADTLRLVKDKPEDIGFITKLVQKFTSELVRRKFISAPQENPFRVAADRHNQMVTLKLAPKGGSEKDAFVVGTYHMPCMFQLPSVMMIHCALSAQHIARYSRGLPYIFCGDYNIKPDSRMYELFTAGRIQDDKCDESPLRFTHPNDTWRAVLQQPLVSAYAVATRAQGGTSDEFSDYRGEPDFTNYAQVRNDAPFIDTLDYIWLGNAMAAKNGNGAAKTEADAQIDDRTWKLQSVLPLKHRKDVQGPLPALGEPSDHVLLSANLELVSKKSAGGGVA